MENINPKIKILGNQNKSSNMQYVDVQNVDIENSGDMNMENVNLNKGGYTNTKSGITNVEGKLNTNTSIKNSGFFNIKKTGEVNMLVKNIENFSTKHPWYFAIINIVIGFFISFFLQKIF